MTIYAFSRLRKTAIALALLMIAPGCEKLGFREWNWHQKLTVSVTTPAGVKSGSSVTRASFQITPKWWGLGDAAGASSSSVRGEAVVVDLGAGRYLFALLKGYTPSTAYEVSFPQEISRIRRVEDVYLLYDKLPTLRATKSVPKELYPLLVTFSEIHDPQTVRRVDPDNLAAAFGKGFVLNDISLTITDEPVTTGKTSTVLDWLKDYYGKYLDGSNMGSIDAANRLANSLGSEHFDTER